ncbi:MAG: SpoIIE family protein phosphatase, partial [Victivallales bacterium]|nr:SpoIIE family protein phosphatase [Victivallales bacterium]
KTKFLALKLSKLIIEIEKKGKSIEENEEINSLISKLFYVGENIVVGYSYLLNNKLQIIASPNKSALRTGKQTWKNKFPKLYNLMERAKKNGVSHGYYKFYDINNKGDISTVGKKYGVISKIPKTNYFLGTTIFLKNYNFSKKKQIKYYEMEARKKAEKKFEFHSRSILFDIHSKTVIIFTIIFIVFIFISYWFAKTISNPIQKLTEKVKGINTENLNFSMGRDEYYGTTEVKELSTAFKFLGDELMEYMDNFKQEVYQRKLIDRELEVAREIQEFSLPKVMPGFSKPEFDIYGTVNPAKKMAGDFYDFYYLTKTKIAVVIGDVSGKGISAAYFMAKTQTLIKAFCLEEKNDPSHVLTKVNSILSKDNKSYMFATVFVGYYDITTGILTYANAGHHAALKLKQNNTIFEFGEQRRPALGFFADAIYETKTEQLNQNEFFILYTDGICEATNSEEELYGKVRLLQSCTKNRNPNIKKMISGIVKDTVVFEGETSQSDDITVIGLVRVI